MRIKSHTLPDPSFCILKDSLTSLKRTNCYEISSLSHSLRSHFIVALQWFKYGNETPPYVQIPPKLCVTFSWKRSPTWRAGATFMNTPGSFHTESSHCNPMEPQLSQSQHGCRKPLCHRRGRFYHLPATESLGFISALLVHPWAKQRLDFSTLVGIKQYLKDCSCAFKLVAIQGVAYSSWQLVYRTPTHNKVMNGMANFRTTNPLSTLPEIAMQHLQHTHVSWQQGVRWSREKSEHKLPSSGPISNARTKRVTLCSHSACYSCSFTQSWNWDDHFFPRQDSALRLPVM